MTTSISLTVHFQAGQRLRVTSYILAKKEKKTNKEISEKNKVKIAFCTAGF